MRKLFIMPILFALIAVQMANAQGTQGSTVTFDANNSTMLFSALNTSQTAQQAYSCYMRHNQAPIQIINANPTGNSNTIAPLQDASGTGTGFFANTSLANNMSFATGGDYGVEFYNYAANHNAVCFAVIAPKGYRFTEYWMSISSNAYQYAKVSGSNSKGATIMRYTYTEGTTYDFTPCDGESLTLSTAGADEEIFSHTLSNAGNILYFKIQYTGTTQFCTHMNKLQLKYVVDGDAEISIPTSDGDTQIHTGYINLGELSEKTAGGQYYFNRNNITDLEDVNIVAGNSEATLTVAGGFINVSAAGDYWVESPAKFRITGAKLTFLPSGEAVTVIGDASTTFTSGGTYLIGDGYGHYLSIVANGTGIRDLTSQESATQWTIKSSGSGYTISTRISGTTRYVCRNSYGTLTTQTSEFVWSYNSTNRYFYTGSTYYIRYNSNNWSATRNNSTSLSFYEVSQQFVSGGDSYTATVYGANGSSTAGTVNTSGSVTLSNLNNDGIKFSVDGPAAFTVDLTLQPLDPNVQTMEFGYNGSDNLVSSSATNFQFNGGETIVIPVPAGTTSPTAIFRNAYNENRTSWYGSASGTGLSNYYLIGSKYETSGSDGNSPSDKVDADQAGTNKIQFSNIESLTTNGGSLKETEFKKADAGYQTITLTTSDQSVYIYSADQPENMIMTKAGKNKNNHIAFTFYDAKLKYAVVSETPKVTVERLYTSTLKRNNVKAPIYNAQITGASANVPDDTSADTEHYFYGVKVTSSGQYGYLTSADIEDAIKTEMANQPGIYSGDVMRTILYVDMSTLHSVSGSADTWKEMMLGTADNCLFFMPKNFNISQEMIGGGIIAAAELNGVVSGEAGTAVTDIVIIDQQPFYTPYSFYTSTQVATYKRTQTNNKPTVTKSTLVLPFSVSLSSNGHPKPTVDSEDEKVTFYNLSGFKKYDSPRQDGTYLDGVAGEATANAVTSGTAAANTPYYVTSTENDATTSFKIEVQGATFTKTTLPDAAGTAHYTSEDGNMTAYGSFSGVEVAKEEGFLYWSKDYFWYSISDYLTANSVKFLPYRAYYTTSEPLTAKEGKFMLVFGNGDTNDIKAVDAQLATDNQKISAVYDLQGRMIGTNDKLSTLSKGLYIVNGKKFFVK